MANKHGSDINDVSWLSTIYKGPSAKNADKASHVVKLRDDVETATARLPAVADAFSTSIPAILDRGFLTAMADQQVSIKNAPVDEYRILWTAVRVHPAELIGSLG
jgi:hypothetical protein